VTGAAEMIAQGVKVFSQEIADLRHSLHILRAQASEKDNRIAELQRRIFDVRRYLIPMQTWDLDDHMKGHVAMTLHITDPEEPQ
jgi:hypothetical protein